MKHLERLEDRIEGRGFTPVFDTVAAATDYTAALVFGAVWRYSQMDDGVCHAAVRTLAEKLGMGKSTVCDKLAALVEAGYVVDCTPEEVEQRRGPGSTRIYAVSPNVRVRVGLDMSVERVPTRTPTRTPARAHVDAPPDARVGVSEAGLSAGRTSCPQDGQVVRQPDQRDSLIDSVRDSHKPNSYERDGHNETQVCQFGEAELKHAREDESFGRNWEGEAESSKSDTHADTHAHMGLSTDTSKGEASSGQRTDPQARDPLSAMFERKVQANAQVVQGGKQAIAEALELAATVKAIREAKINDEMHRDGMMAFARAFPQARFSLGRWRGRKNSEIEEFCRAYQGDDARLERARILVMHKIETSDWTYPQSPASVVWALDQARTAAAVGKVEAIQGRNWQDDPNAYRTVGGLGI